MVEVEDSLILERDHQEGYRLGGYKISKTYGSTGSWLESDRQQLRIYRCYED